MAGRLELLLYPTGFMMALYHFPIPGSNGLWVPIGFISTQPKHLDTAHKLIQSAMARKRYGRRAKFNHKDDRQVPTSFEEGCSFLQYSGLKNHAPVESE